jgi:hypothetical protein
MLVEAATTACRQRRLRRLGASSVFECGSFLPRANNRLLVRIQRQSHGWLEVWCCRGELAC